MEDKRLSCSVKPMLVWLWLVGLYAFPFKSKTRSLTVVKVFLTITFTGLSITSLCCGSVRSVLKLLRYTNKGKTILAVLYELMYETALMYLIVLASSLTPKHLRSFLKKLDEHYERFDTERNTRKFRRVVNVAFLVLFLFAVVSNVVQAQGLAGSSSASKTISVPGLYFVESPVWEYVLPIHVTLLMSFLNAEYFLIFYLLWSSAKQLNRAIESSVADNLLEGDPKLLEALRLRHENVCKLISNANAVIGHFLAVMYIGGIPSLLFVLHGFVYGNLVWGEFVTLLSFFVFVILMLVLLTITGVKLNRKMHKPAEYLLSLNIEKMPGKGSEIVAAFLSRLQGKSIGFHVYHLFTIDTSTIMMVCGTILTYAVVIIQFQPGIGGGGGGSIFSAPLPNPTPSPGPPIPTTLAHTLTVALNGTN